MARVRNSGIILLCLIMTFSWLLYSNYNIVKTSMLFSYYQNESMSPNNGNYIQNKSTFLNEIFINESQCSITIPDTNITLNNIYNINQNIFVNNYNYNTNNKNKKHNISYCISHYLAYNESINTLLKLHRIIGFNRNNFVFPTAKLMIQISAKTGSSTMKSVFNSIRKQFHYSNINSYGLKYMINNPYNIFNMLCSSEYRKIFLIRDPLSRLLSGYLDKCTLATRNENNHNYQFEVCGPYLNYIRSMYNISSMEIFNTNNNTYNTANNFISWINLGYNTNNHFNLLTDIFRGRSLIKDDWEFINIKNVNLWIFILKSVLTENEFKSDLMKKLRNKFRLYCENEINQQTLNHTFGVHSSDADKKLLKYFTSIDILYDALIYTRKDYKYLDLKLPAWICQLFEMNNDNYSDNNKYNITFQFIKTHFDQYQIPHCIDRLFAFLR